MVFCGAFIQAEFLKPQICNRTLKIVYRTAILGEIYYNELKYKMPRFFQNTGFEHRLYRGGRMGAMKRRGKKRGGTYSLASAWAPKMPV